MSTGKCSCWGYKYCWLAILFIWKCGSTGTGTCRCLLCLTETEGWWCLHSYLWFSVHLIISSLWWFFPAQSTRRVSVDKLAVSSESNPPSTPEITSLDRTEMIFCSQHFSSGGGGPPPVLLRSNFLLASLFFVWLWMSCHFFSMSLTVMMHAELHVAFTLKIKKMHYRPINMYVLQINFGKSIFSVV